MIAENALALQRAPTATAHADQSPWGPRVASAGVGAVENIFDKGLDLAGDAPNGGEAFKKGAAKLVMGIPGGGLDGAQVLLAKDKPRALAGVIGSRIGGAIGAAVPVPGLDIATAAAGSILGDMAGTYVYDHRGQFYDAATKIGRDLPKITPVVGF